MASCRCRLRRRGGRSIKPGPCSVTAAGGDSREVRGCPGSWFACIGGGGVDERFGGRSRVQQWGGVVEGRRERSGTLEEHGELVAQLVRVPGVGFGRGAD